MNRSIDVSVPPEVQVGFGREQTPYALAARVVPAATFARLADVLASVLPASLPKLEAGQSGDWERNAVGSLVLSRVAESDYPRYQAVLDAIGLPGPAALFRVELERGARWPVPAEEWQAMLQLLCALARETDGILHQPPGKVWCDFQGPWNLASGAPRVGATSGASGWYGVRHSEALLLKAAVPAIRESATRHDVGTIRHHNEDRVAVSLRAGLAVVADGMGGQSTGAEAAELAVATLVDCLEQQNHGRVCGPQWESHWLVQALKLASARIACVSRSRSDDKPTLNARGLGAAVAAALAVEGGLLIAHVGNARVYRLRDGVLSALTTDHTLVNEHRDALPPDLPPEVLASYKYILTRCLGGLDAPRVDTRFEALSPDDVFLLCTDGLYGVLTEAEMAERLRREQPLSATCQQLIDDANERGTPDNLAVALVRWR